MDLGDDEFDADRGDRDRTRGLPELLTVAEVAALVRVSKMTIYRMIRKGELPAIAVGKSYRIPIAEVRRLTRVRGGLDDTHGDPGPCQS
jgi:excisionase family DNA binding protein